MSTVTSAEGREDVQSLEVEVKQFTARFKAVEVDVERPGSRAAASQPAAPSAFRHFWPRERLRIIPLEQRFSSLTSQHSRMLGLLYLTQALYMQSRIVKLWEKESNPSGAFREMLRFSSIPDGEVEEEEEEVGQALRDSG